MEVPIANQIGMENWIGLVSGYTRQNRGCVCVGDDRTENPEFLKVREFLT